MITEEDADDAFVRHKSRFVLSWAMANLQRLEGHASATSCGTPLAGRTAIVVGASYNLTRNVELLKDAQDAGCVLITVNSADPVLRHYGIVPDVLVIRESLKHDDVVTQSQAPLIVADVCVHPDTWTAAGDRLAWFVPCYPHLLRYAEILGVRPVMGGSAAYTTAVHLARVWGATRIVMVGSGLAPTECEDGWHDYHPLAPRGDQVGTIEHHPQHGEVLRYTGNVANDAVHVASGQPPPGKLQAFERLPSIDWGSGLPVINTLRDQHTWLTTEALRHGAQVEYFNCNEGGIGVPGWRSMRLSDLAHDVSPLLRYAFRKDGAIDPVQIPAVYPVTPTLQRTLTSTLTAEAQSQLNAAEEMLRHGGPRLDTLRHMPGLLEGAPLASALAAWRVIDGPEGNPPAELQHTYESLAAAARDALGILRGT